MLPPDRIDALADASLGAFAKLDTRLRERTARAASENASRAEVRASLAAISKAAAKEITQRSAEAVRDAVTESVAAEEALYSKARVARLLAPYAPIADSGLVKAVLKDGIGGLVSTTNLVRTSAEQRVFQTFIDALDSSTLAVASGLISPQDGVRRAVDIIARTETAVRYVAHDGREITQTLYGAVRRNVMTGAAQTMHRVTDARMEQIGVTYVEVSAHAGARPEHAVWQGKVYAYPDEFMTATGYGTGAGLGGWSCRHNYFPFFPGLSEPTEWAISKDNEADYELSQRQRECERAIRTYKARASIYREAASATGDDHFKALKDHNVALTRKWQAEADSVVAKRSGARRRDREVGRWSEARLK